MARRYVCSLGDDGLGTPESGRATAGVREAFEKLTQIDVVAVSRNASSQSRECRLAMEPHGCQVGRPCDSGWVDVPAVG